MLERRESSAFPAAQPMKPARAWLKCLSSQPQGMRGTLDCAIQLSRQKLAHYWNPRVRVRAEVGVGVPGQGGIAVSSGCQYGD